jgi:hypothetical protein
VHLQEHLELERVRACDERCERGVVVDRGDEQDRIRAASARSSRLPAKWSRSVSTLMPAAPAFAYATAWAAGSASGAIDPTDGERRLTSPMMASSPLARAARIDSTSDRGAR